ncbi:TRAP transporter small permease [Salipiger sp.]|uniref:TRAP transporter small permease n=1 Tax=Salipiger sp. TaxID=2078585 RepID=UPI003A96F505
MDPAILRVTRKVATMLALGAGMAVAVLALLITVDIVGRDGFGVSLQGTDELGGYVLAFVGSLGMALTLLDRAHPRIDIFFRVFPAGLRAVLHVLALAVMAGFALFMTWQALSEFRQTVRFGAITNTPLQTPLWVPQIVWLAGTAFFALTACILMVHGLLLLRRDRARIERLYGPPTVEEEVASYTETETRHAGD